MKPAYQAIVGVSWLAAGVILPVQSLLLMAHGCSLQTLALAIGLYSAVVIAAEFPSGVFADLYGRKTAYLLSCALYLASYLLLVPARSFALTAAALVTQGLGRAFASGSVDALAIEDALARHGEGTLSKTVSLLSVYQCLGITLGALLGGFLPQTDGYLLHIAVRIVLTGVTGALAFCTIRNVKAKPVKQDMGAHFRQIRDLLLGKRSLRRLLLCILAIAVMQFMVETYWQPKLAALSSAVTQGSLGLLCAGGFIATAAGSFFMGKLKPRTQSSYWNIYLALGLMMAVLVFLLSRQKIAGGFAAAYAALYLVIGLLAVPEQTIINLEINSSVRASMLSLMSLAAQIGGVLGGGLSSALLMKADISFLWLAGALIAAACVSFLALRRRADMKAAKMAAGQSCAKTIF